MPGAKPSADSSWLLARPWWTTTTRSWSIPWRITITLCWALLTLALCSSAQSVDALARTYRKNPTDANRVPLARIATAHATDTEGAQALLAMAAVDYENTNYDRA